jgi:hypothetical protein
MIPVLMLLLLCFQVQVYRSPTRDIRTNPVDAGLLGFPIQVYKVKRFVIGGAYKLAWRIKMLKTPPPNIKGLQLHWNQFVFRKGKALSITTPRILRKEAGYWYAFVVLAVVAGYLLQAQPWAHYLPSLPAVMGVTNTWSAAGAGNASVDANWSAGHAPAVGEDIVFNNTSVQNCNWNISVNGLNSTTVAATYSGSLSVSVTQYGISWGAVAIAGGTITGSGGAGYRMWATSLTITGGTINLPNATDPLGATGTIDISGCTWTQGEVVTTGSGAQNVSISVTVTGFIAWGSGGSTKTMLTDITTTGRCIVGGGGIITLAVGSHTLHIGGTWDVGTGAGGVTYGAVTLTTGTLHTDGVSNVGSTLYTGTIGSNSSWTWQCDGELIIGALGTAGVSASWVWDLNNKVTNAGTINLPNGSGTCNISGVSPGIGIINNGTINHDNGLVTVDGVIWLVYLGSTSTTIFYDVTFASNGTAFAYTSTNIVLVHTLTINPGVTTHLTYRDASSGNSTVTFGTVSAAASIVNNGTLTVCGGSGASNTCTIQGAAVAYMTVCTGNDWDWNVSARSYNLKWLDLQFDAVTGGGGVTVNFTGSMGIDGFTVSVGDVLSCTLAGATITGNAAKLVAVNGTLISTGTAGHVVTWTNGAAVAFANNSTVNWQYTTILMSGSGAGYALGINGANITITNFDNVSSTCDGSGGGIVVSASTSKFTATNSTFLGTRSGAWYSQDVNLYAGGQLQLTNCTYTKVGMSDTSGYILDITSGNAIVYGIISSSENPSAGYRAANITGTLALKLADAYGTPYNTSYTLGANLPTTGDITIAASSTLNTGAYNVQVKAGKSCTATGSFVFGNGGSITGDAYSTCALKGAGTITWNNCSVTNIDVQVTPLATPGTAVTVSFSSSRFTAMTATAGDIVTVSDATVYAASTISVAATAELRINAGAALEAAGAITCLGTLTDNGTLKLGNGINVNATGSHTGTLAGSGILQSAGSSSLWFATLADGADIMVANGVTLVYDAAAGGYRNSTVPPRMGRGIQDTSFVQANSFYGPPYQGPWGIQK